MSILSNSGSSPAIVAALQCVLVTMKWAIQLLWLVVPFAFDKLLELFFNLVLTVLGDAVLFACLIVACLIVCAFVACLIVCTCVKTCPLFSFYMLLVCINTVFWFVAIPALIEWLFFR